MKPFFSFPVIFIITLALAGCANTEDFPVTKEYPVLVTREPASVDETGVRLSASVITTGSLDVVDYGFTWTGAGHDYQVSLKNLPFSTDFQFDITGDLIPDESYEYSAYLKTTEYKLYGSSVSFFSKGCPVPQIIDFDPKEGFDGTLIKMIVKNLSLNFSRNKVMVNEKEAQIQYINGDTVVFNIPTMGYDGEATLSLTAGILSGNAIEKFTILGPSATGISAYAGHSGDIILISGRYLIANNGQTRVNFGNYPATILDISDSEIRLRVPVPVDNLLNDIRVDLMLFVGSRSIFIGPFTIKKSWQSRAPFPFNYFYRYKSFVHNGKGYILELNTRYLWEYDPSTDQWSSVSLFPGEGVDASLYIPVGNKVLIMGGDLAGPTSIFWEYDFELQEWSRKADLPFEFSQASSFLLNGTLFIVTDIGQVWTYNLENESITRKNDFPGDLGYLDFAFSFVNEGTAYLITYGQNWIYDEQNDSWYKGSENPFQKEQYSVDAIGFYRNNHAYVLLNGTDLYTYDWTIGNWYIVSNYPGSCGYNVYKTVFTIEDKTYIAATSGNYQDCYGKMYLYDD